MYLNKLKEVTSAQRPSRKSVITEAIDGVLLVKGAATEASASDKLSPTYNI
jgi:hypothetical protein